MIIDLVIPVLNEAGCIQGVLQSVPQTLIRQILVVDNGSTDNSAQIASQEGAQVLFEPKRGYGQALWTAITHLKKNPPHAVAIIAGDGSDDPRELNALAEKMKTDEVHMVVGSRTLGHIESGAMPLGQRIGNFIVPALLKVLYGDKATDLGSSRIIRWQSLMSMSLQDRAFGVTVEMRIKASQQKMRVVEVPVSHRSRAAGEQKISGNIVGSIKAGFQILYTVAKYL